MIRREYRLPAVAEELTACRRRGGNDTVRLGVVAAVDLVGGAAPQVVGPLDAAGHLVEGVGADHHGLSLEGLRWQSGGDRF